MKRVDWNAVPVLLAVLALPTGAEAATASVSPAERRIAAARTATEATPDRPGAWTELALALSRRARETSDPDFYRQGHAAALRALALAPDDFEALKARAWLLLGQHRFADALVVAERLNARAPDDVMVYGLLTDAYVELGRYPEAARSCQWMLDLRPGNLPALTRAAYLRELFGNPEGALELMTLALDQTPASEAEDRAWVLTQIGHLRLALGRTGDAESALNEALGSFPGYHYALGQLARVRTEEGRHAEAARLQAQRYEAAAHAENLFELAEALKRAGRKEESKQAFRRFEEAARAESGSDDNANRELVSYYLDHAHRPAEALRLAEAEFARRKDVFTLEAYALALHANGRRAEARRQMEAALAVGTRDPRVVRHARALGLVVSPAAPAATASRDPY